MNINLEELERKLNYIFQNKELLIKAITHSSYNNENKDSSEGDNERMEFLGDAVLGLSIASYLFEKFPDLNEGLLTEKRSTLVNEENLCRLAELLELGKYLLLGRGEIKNGGFKKKSILANTLESIFGAICLDSNYHTAESIIINILKTGGESVDTEPMPFTSPITELEKFAFDKFEKKPVYNLLKTYGPHHNKVYKYSVQIEAETNYAEGAGTSKKEAKNNAALNLLNKYQCQNIPEKPSYQFLLRTRDVLKDAFSAIRKTLRLDWDK